MAQAKRKNRPRRAKSRGISNGSSWGMLLIGLVSGSVLAALYFGVQEGTKDGFGSGLKALFEQKKTVAKPVRTRPEPEPKKASPKPKFDFYTVLPEIERIIPEADFSEKPEAPTEDVAYVLQAASYEKFTDADRLKAQLTISGFDARVEKVTIEGKGVFYRVRLGPYKDRSKMAAVKRQLAQRGIQALPLKVTNR